MPGNRDKTGKFAKGTSGNPKGRPKVPDEVRRLFREATPDAARFLIETMRDENVRFETRVDCANKIIERVYGKPNQPIDADIDAAVTFVLEGELSEYAK